MCEAKTSETVWTLVLLGGVEHHVRTESGDGNYEWRRSEGFEENEECEG